MDSILRSALNPMKSYSNSSQDNSKIKDKRDTKNSSSVSLLGESSGVIEVDWGNARHSSYKFKDIEEWGIQDLFRYFKHALRDRYNQESGVNMASGVEQIKLIQESLRDFMGTWPSIESTKIYLDWCFDNVSDILISQYGFITPKMLRDKRKVKSFFEDYDKTLQKVEQKYRSSKDESKKDKSGVDLFECKSDSIYYTLSSQGLFFAYLRLKQEHDSIESVFDYLLEEVRRYLTERELDDLYSLTEESGPYSLSMQPEFEDLQRFLTQKLGESFLLISVEYENTDEKTKQQ